jgi:hypothetical protein
MKTQLRKDVIHVRPCRADADPQLCRDLLIRQAFRKQRNNLVLATRESFSIGLRRAGRGG